MNTQAHGTAFVQGDAERGGTVLYLPAAMEPVQFFKCEVETSTNSGLARLSVESGIPATWRGRPVLKGEDLSQVDIPYPPEPI